MGHRRFDGAAVLAGVLVLMLLGEHPQVPTQEGQGSQRSLAVKRPDVTAFLIDSLDHAPPFANHHGRSLHAALQDLAEVVEHIILVELGTFAALGLGGGNGRGDIRICKEAAALDAGHGIAAAAIAGSLVGSTGVEIDEVLLDEPLLLRSQRTCCWHGTLRKGPLAAEQPIPPSSAL